MRERDDQFARRRSSHSDDGSLSTHRAAAPTRRRLARLFPLCSTALKCFRAAVRSPRSDGTVSCLRYATPDLQFAIPALICAQVFVRDTKERLPALSSSHNRVAAQRQTPSRAHLERRSTPLHQTSVPGSPSCPTVNGTSPVYACPSSGRSANISFGRYVARICA